MGKEYTWLYSDQLQAFNGEPLTTLGSQQKEPSLLNLQYPTAGKKDREKAQQTNEDKKTQAQNG